MAAPCTTSVADPPLSLQHSWRLERAKPASCIPLDRAGLVSALAEAEWGLDVPEGSWRR